MTRASAIAWAATTAASADKFIGKGQEVGKLYRLCNALCSSGRDIHSVASLVLDNAANIPAVNAMGCPCVTVGTVFVDEDFGARWCQRSSIKIESSIELSF